MYFCEECKRERGWPGLVPFSHGICELCGRVRDCYEVSSARLAEFELGTDEVGVIEEEK